MDKMLSKEIRNHYQNENFKADIIDMIEKDDELQKKCYDKMDEWQEQLEEDFLKKRLKMLGLCEKKGLDGQVMLYPQIKQARILKQEEFKNMVDRLYVVKDMTQKNLVHLNNSTRKHIEEQRTKFKQQQSRLKKKDNKQDSFFDILTESSDSAIL